MKRSAAVVQLESQLRDMLSPSGGLGETRWVGRLVDLMKETVNTEGKEFLLQVLLKTPQNDKATLTRFIQLGGIEILGNWLKEHRHSLEQEDKQVIHSSLSCLNKLNITLEILDKTEIGKIVNNLHKHPDASIQAKAGTIVSKWKKNVIAPEEPKRPSKPKSKETKIPLPKKQKIEEKIETSENIEEVYIPASPPQEKPIESPPPPQYVAQPLLDIIDDNTPIKKKVRWVDEERLESVKYFYKNDEPSAKCASLRPQDRPSELEDTRTLNVEDFRRRETQMERELNRKVKEIQEKERSSQLKITLANMAPRINYTNLFSIKYAGIKINNSQHAKTESGEASEQMNREKAMLRVIYQKDTDIPVVPRDPPQQNNNAFYNNDIQIIPLFKAGSYPPTIIDLTSQIGGNDYYNPYAQPPPSQSVSSYPGSSIFNIPLLPPMPPAPPSSMPNISTHMMHPPMMPQSMMPSMMPQPQSMIPPQPLMSQPPLMMPQPQMSGRSMIPSMPGQPTIIPMQPIIPQMQPIPPQPAYSQAMPGMSPADPYNLFSSQKRVLFNPITKKPQNYRTVPCKKFHSGEGCERGDNCHFIHDFQYQGRPIPNFQEWKNSNPVRQKNLQSQQYGMGVATYYPPTGAEPHFPDQK